ncbi:MAG: MFS transporter [Desulfobacterales bacterium]|nr:MFS transporter [Desulfobacterales bacterium]
MITQNPQKRNAFSSLGNRNFRLLWTGGMISHMGDELQMVAISWLVLLITDSPFLMGVASGMQSLPRLIFGLLGGVIVDRVNRHKLLMILPAIEMILAFLFALLVLNETIQFWHILIIVPFFGFLKMVFHVCRQAYIFDLVGKAEIMSALALHSSGMNFARIIGPSLAGIVIGAWGAGWCLFLNGLSFIGILIALFMMQPPASFKRTTVSSGILQDLGESFVFLKQNMTIFLLMAAIFIKIVFGLHVQVILPLFARYVLQTGASGFGFLVGAMAVGAVLGGVLLAWIGDVRSKGYFYILSSLIYGLLVIIFSFSSWYALSLFILLLVGMTEMFMKTLNQTLLQLLSPDELRGRILGIRMLDSGMKPLGGLLMGAGAGLLGAPIAAALGAGVCMFVALGLFRSSRIREL